MLSLVSSLGSNRCNRPLVPPPENVWKRMRKSCESRRQKAEGRKRSEEKDLTQRKRDRRHRVHRDEKEVEEFNKGQCRVWRLTFGARRILSACRKIVRGEKD